ncbi:hypothetical protein B0H11DRAFT_2286950 [Mycena galericulata]|nr:hypothetical protein B0H11DRAFT_2286950 [Mycena galericulata]
MSAIPSAYFILPAIHLPPSTSLHFASPLAIRSSVILPHLPDVSASLFPSFLQSSSVDSVLDTPSFLVSPVQRLIVSAVPLANYHSFVGVDPPETRSGWARSNRWNDERW